MPRPIRDRSPQTTLASPAAPAARRLALTLALAGATTAGCGGAELPMSPTEQVPSFTLDPPPRCLDERARDYPETRREPIVDIIHDREVADPYRWLEDESSPEVRAWMDEQDAYARARLERLPARESLRARLEQLSYVDWLSPPAHRGPYFFYWRRHKDREKAIFYVRRGERGVERALLDPNTMSPDGSVSIHGVFPTHDGARVAYKLSRNNADAATLHILDTETGEDLPGEQLVGARYAAPQWTPEGDGFFYTALPDDPAIPPSELPGHASVRFHALGAPQAEDVEHWPASGDATHFLSVELSRDGRYLLVYRQRGWLSTDVYFATRTAQAAEAPDAPTQFAPLIEGRDALYDVTAHDGRFFILTNEGAPSFRVLEADPRAPARARWVERVPERSDTLQDARVIGGRLLLHYLHNARSRLELRSLEGLPQRELPLGGTVDYVVGRADEDDAYFSYSSFTEPPRIFKLSAAGGQHELWDEVSLPVDMSAVEVEQVWYPSRDGTEISMFIVHARGLERDGGHPTLLTGYGGFGVSMTPRFSSRAAVWLERGGVFALPNLRGGGEYGEDWHRAGMGANKQNVFDDFEAAARYLIDEGYTSARRLAISGGSNGGLLVGAAMTQHPELYRAVVCAVPLLDMIRYPQFGAGRTWIPEYGDPARREDFTTLLAYSPYHHVDLQTRYPALLMLSADSDDRVDPMHARKFIAQIQASRDGAGPRPAWLRIEENAGHGGADLVRAGVERDADTYAFLLHELAGDAAEGTP